MGLTNAGRDIITQMLAGEAATAFDNSNAYLGIGNGSTAFDVTQSGLQGASTKRNAMESGYPQRSTNVLTFKASFGGTEANFAWEEWGIFNASTGGTMLNRVVENNGTKQSGQTWVFEVDITISIGS